MVADLVFRRITHNQLKDKKDDGHDKADRDGTVQNQIQPLLAVSRFYSHAAYFFLSLKVTRRGVDTPRNILYYDIQMSHNQQTV